MSRQTYHRVDIEIVEVHASIETSTPPPGGTPDRPESPPRPRDAGSPASVRLWVIPLSLLLCLAQSVVTILASNINNAIINPTLIPGVAFGVIFLLVLLTNPLQHYINRAAQAVVAAIFGASGVGTRMSKLVGWFIRPLNRSEVMCVFAAMMVTSGIATFGLTEQLVPLIATPHNPEWNTPQRGWHQMVPNMNPSLYISDTAAIAKFRNGVNEDADGKLIKPPADDAPLSARFSHWVSVAGGIPWSLWLRPLAGWLVLVFTSYALFYCLAYVVLPYWSQREKLIFPLAKIAESILPDGPGAGTVIPSIFRTPGFWLGFAISMSVLSWNACVMAQWFPGLQSIPLGMPAGQVRDLVASSIWEGLGPTGDFTMQFLIIFTAVGLAFLLPLEISFSIWFYFLLGKFVVLSLVWMGYGKNMNDFPSDWLWFNNPMSAQGGGAIFLFSAVSLYRCVKDYIQLVRGKTMIERVRIALPVVGLLIAMVTLSFWFAWNRVGLGWAMLLVFSLTLLTVGLMRIVAEGGMYWFQSHTSFFHFYKFLGLGKFLPSAVVGPLLPIYSVLFLDIKTFVAPSLLNGAKMHQDAGGSRFKYHVNLILCLVGSVIVSLLFAIFLAHLRGAQQMQGWFYSDGPKWVMDLALNATTSPAKFDPATASWYGVGFLWTALTLFVRRSVFWFPHPIGYIMLINPLITQLWFSFFIGWACKKVVVKYGGKHTFDKVRLVFIGLIVGELMAIFLWNALALLYGLKTGGITLNRYS